MKFTFPLALAGALLLMAANVCRAEMPMLVLNDTNEPPFTTPDAQPRMARDFSMPLPAKPSVAPASSFVW